MRALVQLATLAGLAAFSTFSHAEESTVCAKGAVNSDGVRIAFCVANDSQGVASSFTVTLKNIGARETTIRMFADRNAALYVGLYDSHVNLVSTPKTLIPVCFGSNCGPGLRYFNLTSGQSWTNRIPVTELRDSRATWNKDESYVAELNEHYWTKFVGEPDDNYISTYSGKRRGLSLPHIRLPSTWWRDGPLGRLLHRGPVPETQSWPVGRGDPEYSPAAWIEEKSK